MSKGFDLNKDMKGLVGSYLEREDVSIAKGQLPVPKECYRNVCDYVASKGYLDVLKYLHRTADVGLRGRCFWGTDTCVYAAGGGHLECLKYLHANGCPWTADACSSAARGGHLEVLKYLHANGCPWDKSVCYHAAGGGHLEVLKYLHDNGCPE